MGELNLNNATESEEQIETEITMDDMKQKGWVKNPLVGGETPEMEVTKTFKRNKNTAGQDKAGNAFDTALSGKNYKVDIHTDKGIYCPSTWDAWGKIQEIALKHDKQVGLKFKVAHLVDGGLATKNVTQVMKQENVEEEKAKELIEESKLAKKDKKLYQITDLLTGEVY